MTCRDVEQLLGHFVDAELPPPMLLAVARHAGSCTACDQAARELTELHEAIAHTVEADVAGLDLSRVWPEVERRILPAPPRMSWRRRAMSMPVWGGALAAAASALLYMQMPHAVLQLASRKPPVAVERVAARSNKNQAFIDRLAGKGVAVRREPKSGTTIIWVNYDPSESTH